MKRAGMAIEMDCLRTAARACSVFALLALGAGCAANAPYTANTVAVQEADYRECVRSRAMETASFSDAPDEIARKAGIHCQGHLVVINDKLREENRWHHYYGGFADRYTDALRERTLGDVKAELAAKRR